MKKFLAYIFFCSTIISFSTFAAPNSVDAAVLEGCKFDKARGGDYCPPDDMIPQPPEYCAGTPTTDYPHCCCDYQAVLKINSQYDNEGNIIGTNQKKEKKPILPSIFKAPDLKISIPGMDKLDAVSCGPDQECSIPWLAKYIGGLQRYAIGIIGIIAVITLMMGGLRWLTAGGDSHKIGEAQNWIVGSLTGLVLTLGAYMLLYTINPELTILRSINLGYINKIDLNEAIIFDPVEADKNIKSGQQIPLGKYCGCIEWKNTKSTSTLTTAAAIDEAVKKLHPTSPLNGLGNVILAASNESGIDPAFFLGNAKMDSDMGTSGAGKTNLNPGNIKCNDIEACKKYSSGCSSSNFNKSATWEDAVKFYFCFMGKSKNMGNAKTIRQMISTYAPPCIEKRKDGNVCGNNTAHYIDFVTSIIAQYNSAATQNDGSEGKSCDCYNPCDRCAQAGEQCCAPK